mmetsp:Transcript_113398/g.219648  ORF Transcript_113398/g.219648 Transcript_113398/m.219648 type:complete len:291 (-) Transcript_113398:17-889(-)
MATGNDSVSDGSANMAFIRITLIGAAKSGKTSLVNAFVSNAFYTQYQPTRDLTLYYTTLRVAGTEDEPDFNCLVEIEDTWACNKIGDEKMELVYNPWWPSTKESALQESLMKEKWQTDVKKDKKIGADRTVLNPFSMSTAPVLETRDCDPCGRDMEGRRYQPLTRNRMVYFIVFDCNEPESYKIALSQEKALYEYLKKKDINVRPVVVLVATKIDENPGSPVSEQVLESAGQKSTKEGVPYERVSALKFQGVKRLFRKGVMMARMNQQLWLLESGIRTGNEANQEACCMQ